MFKKTCIGVVVLIFIVIAGVAFANRRGYTRSYPWADAETQRKWQKQDEYEGKTEQMRAKDSNKVEQLTAERRKRNEIKKQEEATMTPIERRMAFLEKKIEKLEQRISALENPTKQPPDIQDSQQNPDVNEPENSLVEKK